MRSIHTLSFGKSLLNRIGDLDQKLYNLALEKLSKFDVEIIDDVPSIDYKKIKAEKIKVWQK